MKTLKFFMLAVVALVAGVAFTGCVEDEPTPTPKPVDATVDVTVADLGINSVKIAVKTQNIIDFAYKMSETELDAVALFGTGTKVTIENADVESINEISFSGLDSGVTYKVYFAFHTANGLYYDEVVCAEFTTLAYTDNITVVDTMYDGFKVFLKIPEQTKARGNALRYTTADLAFYNYTKAMEKIDADMLLTNAQQCTTEDKLIIYDDYHSIERDENGDPLYDEYGNLTSATYAETKVPGEPGVFFTGEFSWYTLMEGIDPATGEPDTGPYGWGEGYFIAEFDWEAWYAALNDPDYDPEKYWTGYHESVRIDTKAPETFDGDVTIDVYDKTPINALLRFTPTDNVAFYLAMILEESEYQTQVLPLLENNEDYMQWFVTSVFGNYSFGWIQGDTLKDVKLTEWFADTKGLGGKTIRVCVTAMGDNKGHTQFYRTTTFTLPEVTLPKPEVIVTPIESDDPYNAHFNIKAADPATNPVNEVKFAANYVREYDKILKTYSYTELLKQMGNPLGSAEIEQINTEKGLDISFSSRENATTRIAVLAYNWEGSSNDPDANESPAVAEVTTPHANYPTRVNSPLFDELCGEWVATADMIDYKEEGWTPLDKPYTSDVTISAGIEYPEELPESVYEVYANAGISRAKTEELWEEFVEQAKTYNNRTRGFNRLLCMGYNFADPIYALSTVADPYTLFAHEEYGFAQVSDIFYDFGPKWNLEIDADGSVWLPINIEREFPLETFNFGLDYTFYMLAIGMNSHLNGPVYDKDGKLVVDSRFPVEVSDDRNTITINPIVYNYKDESGNPAVETYYPCVAQIQNGYATPLTPRVAGPVVLTRKGATRASVERNESGSRSEADAVPSMGEAPKPLVRSYSMTPMDISMMRTPARVEKPLNIERGAEALHERVKKFAKDIHNLNLE